MIGRLNHVAIAVPDLEAATAIYRDQLGAKVSDPLPLPEHGVTTVFIDLGNTKSSSSRRSERRRPSRAFSPATRPAASITSATRSRTSSPPATP